MRFKNVERLAGCRFILIRLRKTCQDCRNDCTRVLICTRWICRSRNFFRIHLFFLQCENFLFYFSCMCLYVWQRTLLTSPETFSQLNHIFSQSLHGTSSRTYILFTIFPYVNLIFSMVLN